MKRVLVCGGRDYQNSSRVQIVLSILRKEFDIECIIEGGATGADTFAGDWADSVGIPRITYSVTPEDWRKFGKSAGHRRNTKMLIDGKPDLVIAFPGGRGTANMIKQARNANIAVNIIQANETPLETYMV
jgi:hypothetical protein